MNLRELAALLDLSQTTVSRALNGYPEVSPATRDRVRRAAADVGYLPNQRARALATGRAMTVGHVIPTTIHHEVVNPIFAEFLAGAGATYAAAGYDLQLTLVDDEAEVDLYRRLAARQTVDGLIVHAPLTNDTRIAVLQDLGLPFVVHGRAGGDASDYSWVDIDNRRAFLRATDFLVDLGHRRIGLINGIERMNFAARRRMGYIQALEDRGLRPDATIATSGEMTEQYGYEAASALLGQPDPPTALLVSSIVAAFGVKRAARDRGMTLGDDLSVVAHDDMLSYMPNAGPVPIFTATRSSVREAGALCAANLLTMIRTPTRRPTQTVLEAHLVLGTSTGPIPDRG